MSPIINPVGALFEIDFPIIQAGMVWCGGWESSAMTFTKKSITAAAEGEPMLTLKQLTPVRLIKNAFFGQIAEAGKRGASKRRT